MYKMQRNRALDSLGSPIRGVGNVVCACYCNVQFMTDIEKWAMARDPQLAGSRFSLGKWNGCIDCIPCWCASDRSFIRKNVAISSKLVSSRHIWWHDGKQAVDSLVRTYEAGDETRAVQPVVMMGVQEGLVRGLQRWSWDRITSQVFRRWNRPVSPVSRL